MHLLLLSLFFIFLAITFRKRKYFFFRGLIWLFTALFFIFYCSALFYFYSLKKTSYQKIATHIQNFDIENVHYPEQEFLLHSLFSDALVQSDKSETEAEHIFLLEKSCENMQLLQEKYFSRKCSSHLFTAHFTILLCRYRFLSKNSTFDSIITENCQHLYNELFLSPDFLISSYDDVSGRWTADNFAIVKAIKLSNQVNLVQCNLLLKRIFEKYQDFESNLTVSEINSFEDCRKFRGSSLIFQSEILFEENHEKASRFWKIVKDCFKINYVFFVGFREYQKNCSGAEDYDSGMLLHEISSNATGLALSASAYANDRRVFEKIFFALCVADAGIFIFFPESLPQREQTLAHAVIFKALNRANFTFFMY